IECETVREPDGLAMSSRNVRLTKEEREMATLIPKALKKAAEMRIHGLNVLEIKERIHILFNINDLYKLEYFEICHQNSLEPVFSFNSGTNYIALIACFVGKTRLIDNIVI
ncbi:MAG: pantoate--beta-alanine ligase, partial [Bacteroidia bacterium]